MILVGKSRLSEVDMWPFLPSFYMIWEFLWIGLQIFCAEGHERWRWYSAPFSLFIHYFGRC